MSPNEHKRNMHILEGSFRTEGLTLSDETKKNLELLANGKVTGNELVSHIMQKYHTTENNHV